MSLKKRLVMAFIIIVGVPILLFSLIAVLPNSNKETDGSILMMPPDQALIIFMLIICITACVLVFWLYRSVVQPLNVLTEAIERIRGGDFESSLPAMPDRTDELGKLCSDFDDMRLQIKSFHDARELHEQGTRDMITNISHDLKTPLTAIKGYTEGILDGVADTPEKREKYLKTIYTKASSMAVLVDELSLYSKIDTNTIPYSFTEIDTDKFFNDCVDEMRLDTESRNIILTYTSMAEFGQKMWADPEQLRRVVSNCINNSIKYMDKRNGLINILTSCDSEFVRISISDNGIGIEEKDLPYIFDRFYRTDSSRNSKSGGSGLGLAIVKKIIEDHGGTISAKSVAHEGTTITFTILRPESERPKPVSDNSAD